MSARTASGSDKQIAATRVSLGSSFAFIAEHRRSQLPAPGYKFQATGHRLPATGSPSAPPQNPPPSCTPAATLHADHPPSAANEPSPQSPTTPPAPPSHSPSPAKPPRTPPPATPEQRRKPPSHPCSA